MTTTAIQSRQLRVDRDLEAQPPREALRFEFSALQFAKAEKGNAGSDTKSRAIEILARTPNALNHWYWGKVVHDFSGMTHKSKIVLDYCHSNSELVGYADEFIVDARGLTLRGRIESVSDDDPAETILKRFDKGLPFEGSIYFEPVTLEYVPPGFVAEVNGQQFEGEGLIVREWALRACSVCPHGYDYGTETKLAMGGDKLAYKWKGTMEKTNADNQNDLRAELKLFTDRFGAVDGLTYFNAGKSLGDATAEQLEKVTKLHADGVKQLGEEHSAAIAKLSADHSAIVGKLTTERDEALAAKAEAELKLTAAQKMLGEDNPLKHGGTGDQKTVSSFAEARAAAKKS